jgi:heme-degrading monooxygenase HmoA
VVEYLQWDSLAAFKTAVQSAAYQAHRAAIGGETMLVATPCRVAFVDDARPGIDQLDLVLITEKLECVTMISVFEVQPGRRDELLKLLQRDHESFLSKFEGFIGVAFLPALQDENKLLEVLQFQSLAAFHNVPTTPSGAAHLAAVARLTTTDHNIYHVHTVFGQASEDAAKAFA